MATKYEIIVNKLEKELINGVYNKTKKLPTEEELMKRFEVSRNTIRKSVEVLVGKGYVYQIQGSGVFLRNFISPGSVMTLDNEGLIKPLNSQKKTVKLLDLSLINADEIMANRLKCKIGTKIYLVKRIKYINDVAFEMEESYYNKEVIPYLNEEICNDSIFKYIKEDLNLKLGFVDEIISCDKLNEEDAKLLNLKKDDPYFYVEKDIFLTNGTLFLFSINKYNYTKAKFLSLANL